MDLRHELPAALLYFSRSALSPAQREQGRSSDAWGRGRSHRNEGLAAMLGQTRIYGAERPRCAHTGTCQVFKSVSDYDAT